MTSISAILLNQSRRIAPMGGRTRSIYSAAGTPVADVNNSRNSICNSNSNSNRNRIMHTNNNKRNPAVITKSPLSTATATTRSFSSFSSFNYSSLIKINSSINGNIINGNSSFNSHRRSVVTITKTKAVIDDTILLTKEEKEKITAGITSSSTTTTTNKVNGNPSKQNPTSSAPVTVTATTTPGMMSSINKNKVDEDNNYIYNTDSTLIVTKSCLNRVETLLKLRDNSSENDGYFLRVYVDAGGCSGFQYQFEIDNQLDINEEDSEDVIVVSVRPNDNDGDSTTTQKPRIVVDTTSLGFLGGSTIDYVIEMIKSSFVVSDNPQSESACGCGSSFAIKNFETHGAKD